MYRFNNRYFYFYFGDGLVRGREEMISQKYLFNIMTRWIMGDGWVKVEQEGQLEGLVGVEELVLEAEALNLIKIHRYFFWINLVNGNTRNRPVRPVEYFVEAEGRLACVDHNGGSRWLELPRNLVLSMRHEGDAELTEHINLRFLELVLLVRS